MPIFKNPFKKKSPQPLTVQVPGAFPIPYVKSASPEASLEACKSMVSQYYGGKLADFDGTEIDGYHNSFSRPFSKPIIIRGTFSEEGVTASVEHSLVIKGEDATHFIAHCPCHGANVKIKKLVPYIHTIYAPRLQGTGEPLSSTAVSLP